MLRAVEDEQKDDYGEMDNRARLSIRREREQNLERQLKHLQENNDELWEKIQDKNRWEG